MAKRKVIIDKDSTKWFIRPAKSFQDKFWFINGEPRSLELAKNFIDFLATIHKDYTDAKCYIWVSGVKSQEAKGKYNYKSIVLNSEFEIEVNYLVHEIGHFIDHNELKCTRKNHLTLCSEQPESNKLILDWLNAVEKSDLVKNFNNYRNKSNNEEIKKQIDYLISSPELFARSYETYIFYKLEPYNDDENSLFYELSKEYCHTFHMKRYLSRFETIIIGKDCGCPAYWDKEDFVEIYRCMDNLFK